MFSEASHQQLSLNALGGVAVGMKSTKRTPTSENPPEQWSTAECVDARSAVAHAMTEKQLSQNIVDAARTLGWLVYRTFDSRRSVPGYPDLTMIHPDTGRLIFAELKTAKGRLRPAQIEWLGALREVARDRGLEVYCFRPMDWIDGTIEAILRGDR